MKQNRPRKVLVIGAGFAGLSAAIAMAQRGYRVTILETHNQTGGRARILQAGGFTFDMGPSWYWMPEVMSGLFARCGRRIEDYLALERLDPSYQVIFDRETTWQIPASFPALQSLFESVEAGAGQRLYAFMQEARYKYETAMHSYIMRPAVSALEFLNLDTFRSFLKMDLLRSFESHARRFFRDPRLLRLIAFPVLFLGATASKIPALYSMMNYADMELGTWYPAGGMGALVKAITQLALETDVTIELNTSVAQLEVKDGRVTGAHTNKGFFAADVVISGADYHHTDQQLLPREYRNYTAAYWQRRQIAPSALLYYLGVNCKLPRLQHHNLFFENDLTAHAAAIYQTPSWPDRPLFYCCAPSKTDPAVAPPGMENLFF